MDNQKKIIQFAWLKFKIKSNEKITFKQIFQIIDEMEENKKTMNDLQKEFESSGFVSWINSDLYPDGKIYTKEYTEWLEKKIHEHKTT